MYNDFILYLKIERSYILNYGLIIINHFEGVIKMEILHQGNFLNFDYCQATL